MAEKELIAYLKRYFTYNSDGTLTRTDVKSAKGTYDKDGYLVTKIKSKCYKVHRLAYAIHNNELPKGEIDHINRVRDDNRIENLRVVSRIENVRNSIVPPNKITGVRGVYYDTTTKGLKKKFTTKLGGKTYRFRTLQEAINKRVEYYDNDMRMITNEGTD